MEWSRGVECFLAVFFLVNATHLWSEMTDLFTTPMATLNELS